jgi:hypothetical protein
MDSTNAPAAGAVAGPVATGGAPAGVRSEAPAGLEWRLANLTHCECCPDPNGEERRADNGCP